MEVVASAPGKITLYGEHAVVYGKPAIVASIDKRVYVRCRLRSDKSITIRALNLQVPGIILTYNKDGEVILKTDYGRVLSAVSYIREAINLTSRYLNEFKGADLTIESNMPVGAGLGTSAAVSVATIAAYSKALGHDLDLHNIAKLAWNTEKNIQGIASPMDTSISTFGGIVYLTYDGVNFSIDPLHIDVEFNIVIGYVKRQYKTKEMVEKVKSYLQRHPDLVKPIIDLIGDLVNDAKKALIKGDLEYAGELMNINHGLLDALGVSSKELNDLVYAARAFGAYGSKLSGAGGGGSMIALTDSERVQQIITAIRILNGLPIGTEIGGDGVRYESIDKNK
ncbi:mevalonate kinase [Candidatus Geothermarchaeota archaeon]|nr:MAG: mevalonate kinase [Candidatus Geothermarchaeota archaeon]RLG62403.1 MAG: mevalonate kinase [Candidatus Geothermarchaeota archaeon]HEW93416.1 mevalonate kinase [Thermoprotei archaeon]